MYWLNGSAITVPTRRAVRARTIRVRSSPRCSKNDILLSSTDPVMPSLPARDEVSEGAHASAGLEPLADRGGDERLPLADRVAQRVAARQARRDRRREGAAGPVRAGRRQPRSGEAREVAAVPQDVGRRVPQVAALHQHVLGTEGED